MVAPLVRWSRGKLSGFLGELKRRQVLKVAVVYAIVGLAVAEGADVFLGNLAPAWVLQASLVLLLVGFPVCLGLAWAYDLTPEGLVRDDPEHGLESDAAQSREAVAKAPADVDDRTIAVLPFENLSSDPENDYFADGVTDDVLTSLTLIDGLRVTSRTSVMRYRGTDKSTVEIARELGVAVILEGSVRRMDKRVRVVAQLVDAQTDAHLWAATYDRELEDVFAVQSDVAENVATALRSKLSARGKARLATPKTDNIKAYELVVRARHAYLQTAPEPVTRGIQLLRDAIELDPDYAEAWAHLAIAHVVLPFFSTVEPTTIEADAREAIDRAFALDSELPEAFVARGYWRFNFRFDWVGAERDFTRALELNPSSADAYEWRGVMHLLCRNTEQAVADARASVALDPLSFQTRYQLSQNLLYAGRGELAHSILLEIIGEDPDNFIARWALGIVVRAHDPAAALRHFDVALGIMDVPLAHASRTLALRMLGRAEEADRIVEELEARREGPEFVSPFAMAVGYFGRGDVDLGLDSLEDGVERRDFLTLYMRLVAPAFGIDQHPRYLELVRTIWPDEHPTVPRKQTSAAPVDAT